MNIEWKRLGDYCLKIGSGATPKGGKEFYQKSGPFTFIRSQNIYNDHFSPDGLVYIQAEQAKKLDGVAVEANDILLNITGDSVVRVCLALDQYLPARVNQHVAIIRPQAEIFDSRFLRYFLVSPYQQNLMLGLAAAGATRNALTKGMIEDFKIPCPEIEIQTEIADILATIDNRITLLRETNATLEAIAQALFKSWFVDFDPVHAKQQGRVPQGMDAETAALFPDSCEESELGLIPKGWRVGVLENCCLKVESGGTPKRINNEYWNGTIAWLTSGEVRQPIVFGTKEQITELGVKNSSAKIWGIGTTVVAMYGTTVGEVCLLAQPSTANQACCGLIPKKNFMSFLFFCIRREKENLAAKSFGSAQQNLNKGLIAKHQILLPSEQIIESYEKSIGTLLKGWIKNEKHSQTLFTLRDTLLPRLISGQLRIQEAEALLKESAL